MHDDLRIEYLADHPETLPLLAHWFEAEWPAWYRPGGPGDALADLRSYGASRSELPIGLVALRADGAACGVVALKAESIATHRHLGPWIAAGFVLPADRGQGIGAALVRAVEGVARERGHARLWCASATAGSLLERAGFVLREHVEVDGDRVAVYEKALRLRKP